jgi:hypothetical protein
VFARKADDDLASFAKRLDDVVIANKDKKAKGTVILLAKKPDVAPKLEAIAKAKSLAVVPLTVSKDGADGPEDYKISKTAAVTVVVYDKEMQVVRVLTFEKLDQKSQDAALAAFAKVLEDKKDEKKDEKKEK